MRQFSRTEPRRDAEARDYRRVDRYRTNTELRRNIDLLGLQRFSHRTRFCLSRSTRFYFTSVASRNVAAWVAQAASAYEHLAVLATSIVHAHSFGLHLTCR